MSEEDIDDIKNMTKSNINFAPTFVDNNLLADINFNDIV